MQKKYSWNILSEWIVCIVGGVYLAQKWPKVTGYNATLLSEISHFSYIHFLTQQKKLFYDFLLDK